MAVAKWSDYTGSCREGLRNTTKNVGQDCRRPDRDSDETWAVLLHVLFIALPAFRTVLLVCFIYCYHESLVSGDFQQKAFYIMTSACFDLP